MRKDKQLYSPPQVDVETFFLEQSFTASVNVPGTTVEDAEEQEWIVS